MSALFACTKCNSRHPFEELSQGQQLCKSCRGSYPVVKCTYCRTEFQQENKSSTSSICKKCEQNIKMYGKPSACEFCNIIAAFIGTKCQRCTNSLKKYGPPVTCEQCRQKCAFNRKDDNKKVDGKLLCWLCTMAYRRAVAKAKQNNPHLQNSSSSSRKSQKHSSSNPSTTSTPTTTSASSSFSLISEPSSKKSRLETPSKTTNGASPLSLFSQPDSPPIGRQPLELFKETSTSSTNSGFAMAPFENTDHIVVVTQLKEQIASLQKQLALKDQQIIAKDKQITEITANNASAEKEYRNKIQTMQRENAEHNQELQQKIRALNKQVVSLTKASKKGTSTESPSS